MYPTSEAIALSVEPLHFTEPECIDAIGCYCFAPNCVYISEPEEIAVWTDHFPENVFPIQISYAGLQKAPLAN